MHPMGQEQQELQGPMEALETRQQVLGQVGLVEVEVEVALHLHLLLMLMSQMTVNPTQHGGMLL